MELSNVIYILSGICALAIGVGFGVVLSILLTKGDENIDKSDVRKEEKS